MNTPYFQPEAPTLLFAIFPSKVSQVSESDEIQFSLDPELLPAAERIWRSTSGHIDTSSGHYTSNQSSGTSSVTCSLSQNNVLYLSPLANIQHMPETHPARHWQQPTGKVNVTNFPKLPVRAYMHGNGAQQLRFTVEITIEDGNALPEEEWSNFAIFDYYSHQAVTNLNNGENPPLLTDDREWALSNECNEFTEAGASLKPSLTSSTEPSPVHPYYLHSQAQAITSKVFHPGFCDSFGWWHYFKKPEHIFEVSILQFTPPELTIALDKERGFGEVANGEYRNERYYETIEYFKVLIPGGFKYCESKGYLDDTLQRIPRKTIVRYERDALAVDTCSVTGIITEPDQTSTTFDVEITQTNSLKHIINNPLETTLPKDSIILCLHRTRGARLETNRSEAELLLRQYAGNLVLEFIDKAGNRFEKNFGFIPKGQSRHRDHFDIEATQ